MLPPCLRVGGVGFLGSELPARGWRAAGLGPAHRRSVMRPVSLMVLITAVCVFKFTLRLVFEPREERCEGAKLVVSEEKASNPLKPCTGGSGGEGGFLV